MLHELSNPIGAHKIFQSVNRQMFDNLRTIKSWGSEVAPILENDWECFGQARVSSSDGRRVAQVPVYSTQGNDYRDAFLDDEMAITSFWLLDDTRADVRSHHVSGQTASFIMFCNLARLYPTRPIGAEEQLKADLLRFFNSATMHGLDIEQYTMVVGLPQALREFDGPVRDAMGDRTDAYPWMTIRFNFPFDFTYNSYFPKLSK